MMHDAHAIGRRQARRWAGVVPHTLLPGARLDALRSHGVTLEPVQAATPVGTGH